MTQNMWNQPQVNFPEEEEDKRDLDCPWWWGGVSTGSSGVKLEHLLMQKNGDNHHRPLCTSLGCHTWEAGPELNRGNLLALRNHAAWEQVRLKSYKMDARPAVQFWKTFAPCSNHPGHLNTISSRALTVFYDWICLIWIFLIWVCNIYAMENLWDGQKCNEEFSYTLVRRVK